MTIHRFNHDQDRVPLKKVKSVTCHARERWTFDLANCAPLSSTDRMFYVRDQAFSLHLKKLSEYPHMIDATLDLHHYRSDDAHHILKDYFVKCWHSGKRSVLIIHGQGDPNGFPVLKNIVYQWLKAQILVLGFASMPVHAGSTGACCVLLGEDK